MTTPVREHLTTLLTNVVNNRVQIANQIAQHEQQLSVMKDQYDTSATLVAGLQPCSTRVPTTR